MPGVKRAKVESDEEEDTKLPAVKQESDNEDNQGQMGAVLQRLGRLEADTKSLKCEVKRLEACVPTVLVEFKFASSKTLVMRRDNAWKGHLHIPMIQHPVSGVYTVPSGTTKVQGQYKFQKWGKDEATGKYAYMYVDKPKSFVAELEREPGNPVNKFRLGINLEYLIEDEVVVDLEPCIKSCKKESDSVYFSNPNKHSENPYATTNIQEFVSEDQDMMKDWEENAGGLLSFYAPASFEFDPEFFEEQTGGNADAVVNEAKYKLKLYTVLSAYKPHQTTIPPVEEEAKPDWESLYVVMKTRYPNREYGDIVRAVKQYILFLELKQEHNDYKSEKFSPSAAIDEIWHAHLSFLDRYQKDIQAMTKTSMIFEHNPVLGNEATARYKAALEAHTARMTALGKSVDRKFWPAASSHFEEAHDGDSSEELYLPQAAQCG